MVSLQNATNMTVNLFNYGATIKDIFLTDAKGAKHNMVLSYDNVQDYYTDEHYLGCVVGRYANRIAGGKFKLEGKTHQLSLNEKGNHLHGGFKGLSKKVWDIKNIIEDDKEIGVIFSIVSPDMDEGYPGELKVEVKYNLTNDNELFISYSASTNKPTIINLTNHSYFNLSGGQKDISNYRLAVIADVYTPANESFLPAGTVKSLNNTLFDLRQPLVVESFMRQVPTINYCLDNHGRFEQAAVLSDEDCGITLTVKTNAPGLQIYFGQYLNGKQKPFYGICLESQNYPDAPNQPKFPSALLMPGQVYQQLTSYQFTFAKNQ